MNLQNKTHHADPDFLYRDVCFARAYFIHIAPEILLFSEKDAKFK